MHLTDGELHAYADGELVESAAARAQEHLAGCVGCQQRYADLSARAGRIAPHLAALAPLASESPRSTAAARARLQARLVEMEKLTLFQKIFARPYRPAWIALAVVLILAVALAFPPVQAIANSFLGLFRVQEFTIVQVNPGDLPEQLGSSSQFEQLLSDDVQVEELGEPQEAASQEEASALAGFPVRLPAGMESEPRLMVQPGTRVTATIDLPRVRALLNEIGRADLELPDDLDGATVTLTTSSGVAAGYGDCEFDRKEAGEEGFDPDGEIPRLPDCTTLIQMPSPEISAPPGLDIAQIGEVFLQLVGMSPEEAAHFSQTIDWSTTLVVPIPRYGTEYQDVAVDGVNGTLIMQNLEDHARQYMLMWVRDGIVYALTGPGDRATALEIAGSLK